MVPDASRGKPDDLARRHPQSSIETHRLTVQHTILNHVQSQAGKLGGVSKP